MHGILVLLGLSLAAVKAEYSAEALADQVVDLPGAENLKIPFNQFSGYLDIPGTSGSLTKKMHYWFVESSKAPSTDPVAFWTNGGPGCSGLLGFLSEQGPFRPNKDMSLSMNPYAWNTIANMVFIESPCGVGFSYSEDGTGDDYTMDDAVTATDNYNLIQAFMARFPQYQSNEMYITSESYGGHYMPTLAQKIVDNNAAKVGPVALNFKGFAVGNPATTKESTIPASLETYWGHQIISKPLWDDYSSTCLGTHPKDWEKCEQYFLQMYRQIDDLNPYALDYPVCLDDERKSAKHGRGQRTWLMNFVLDGYRGLQGAAEANSSTVTGIRNSLGLEPVGGYEPCEEDYLTAYLNLPAVQTALHVKEGTVWADCSRSIRYKQSDGLADMTPIYKYLIDGGFGLNILVYSGDDDDVCATVGTQEWIWDLGYEAAKPQWDAYKVEGQVGGYITKWKNTKLAFATVHGAGHEVPTYKPEVALWLFDSYLKGELTNK